MANQKDTPVRVQFEHNTTAQDILKGIRDLQDKWAIEHPQLAHEKYPTRYAADGSVIPGAGK
ncbi:MAG: hypothetical protein ABI621_11225 [Chloroflexota bacterium]